MHRKVLISNIAKKTGKTRVVVRAIMEAMGVAITEALKSGEAVSLPSLGKFWVKDAPAMKGRNLRTGEKITIPAKKRPMFRAFDALKAAMQS